MQRLWGSKTNDKLKQKLQQKQTAKRQLYLPNYIGCKIIELEMYINQAYKLQHQTIIQLIQAYTQAIQFYQENNEQKYLLYQKKMQSFIQKPMIALIMKGKKSQLTLRKQKKQEQMRKVASYNKTAMHKIIQSSKEEKKKQQRIAKGEIQQQQKKLQERLERKRTNSSRLIKQKLISASFSFPSNQNQQQYLVGEFIIDLPQPTNPM